jgi:hypothetical protein
MPTFHFTTQPTDLRTTSIRKHNNKAGSQTDEVSRRTTEAFFLRYVGVDQKSQETEQTD